MVDSESSNTTERKRRRPPLSCEPCRRRKIRCDREVPCGQCVRARNSTTCSYSPDVLATGSVTGLQSIPIPQLESGLHSASYLGTTNSTPHGAAIPSDRNEARNDFQESNAVSSQTYQDLRDRVRQLEQLLSDREHDRTSHTDQNLVQAMRDLSDRILKVEQKQPRNAEHLSASESPSASSIPVATPRLRIMPEKTKLFGQSHWLYTFEEFQLIGKLDAKQTGSLDDSYTAELGGLLKDVRNIRRSLKDQRLVKPNEPIPNLLGTLPERAICDQLVRQYLRTFELIYRIVHIPSFWNDYNQFWEQPRSAPKHFVMKLVLILAIGSTFHASRAEFDCIRPLAREWIYAAHWWLTGPLEKSTYDLDGVQVFCLLLLARQTNSLAAPAWISTGSLLNRAFSIGLHRDPVNFPALSVFQSEMRRRLWATVLELTVQSTLDSAMPLFISAQDFDCEAPLNVDDTELNTEITVLPSPKDTSVFTHSSLQILLLRSLQIRMKLVKLTNDFRQPQSYQTALELSTQLQMACRELAVFFHSHLPRFSDQESGPNDFHRKFLDMYLRKYILFLHRAFMVQARKDPQFYLSRKVCLESAMIITSYIRNMKLPSNDLDDFARLTIWATGSLKGAMSQDVIMALSLEVVTQLEEEAATRPSGSLPVASDPLDEMAKASRLPMIQTLEHILDQLLQIIALGNPGTKRYLSLSAILSQIRALESGQPVKPAVYETMRQSLRDCRSLMQTYITTNNTVGNPVAPLTDATGPFIPTTVNSFGFDFESMIQDPSNGFDMSNLFFFPGVN